jgi:hypothetical protein
LSPYIADSTKEEAMPLQKPTVAEVIAILQDMPPDAPLRVETAETPGREDMIHIDLDALGRVWVSGARMQ